MRVGLWSDAMTKKTWDSANFTNARRSFMFHSNFSKKFRNTWAKVSCSVVMFGRPMTEFLTKPSGPVSDLARFLWSLRRPIYENAGAPGIFTAVVPFAAPPALGLEVCFKGDPRRLGCSVGVSTTPSLPFVCLGSSED